jgi:formamidopyrimidine-DNA glycosylase
MPELPDVEVFRRYLDSTGLHQKIKRVEVQDDRILEGVDPDRVAKTLARREFDSSTRHGKYLFARFARIDGSYCILG